MHCPDCGANVADALAVCPACGARLDTAWNEPGDRQEVAAGAPAAGSFDAAQAPPTAVTRQDRDPELRFDPRRWSIPDLVVAIASVVLVVSLFLDWYTFRIPFAGSTSRSGTWTSESLYAAFALSVEALVYLAARSVWSELQFKGRIVHHAILIGLTAGSLAVTLIAFITTPTVAVLGVTIPVATTYGADLAVAAAALATVASVGQLVLSLTRAQAEPVAAAPPAEAHEPSVAEAEAEAEAGHRRGRWHKRTAA